MIDGCIDYEERDVLRCSPDQHQEVSVDSYHDITIQNNQKRPYRLRASASILALLLLSCYLPLVASSGNSNAQQHKEGGHNIMMSPFRIVIDAGSTGSRLHIFEMVSSSSSSSGGGSGSGSTTSATDAADTRIECLRRGSSKAWTPLSAFAPSSQEEHTNDNSHNEKEKHLNATHVAHHMLPLFDYASIIIPQQYHSTTPVRIAATAGMRLVSPDEQILVYDALYEGLMEQQTPNGQFSFINLKRDDIITLDGEREAYFGAVAANYLRGVIDAELRVIVPSDEEEDEDEQNVIAARKQQQQQQQGVQSNNGDDNKKGICTNKFKMCEQDAEDVVFGPSQHYVSQQQRHDVKAHGPLGALDMGGSSTQIVYRRNNNSNSNRKDADSSNLAFRRSSPSNNGNSNDDGIENLDIPSHLNDEEFFSTSYLSYGADQFRERLWDLWVVEATNQLKDDTADVNKKEGTKTLPVIKNPCSFVGYEHEYRGFILRGTGNAILCAEQINRLIPHHDNVIDLDELFDENREAANKHLKEQTQPGSKRKLVGGVEHPPITGKFYGMSLYFFTLDCLRELSDPDHPIHVSWPTPSIEELTHALDGFCSRKWQGDLEEVQHEAHEHTRAEVLPHRCVEAVYMVTLLRDGFGFHPSSRDITFTQWVDGNEVEWSLGMALSEYAIERRQQT